MALINCSECGKEISDKAKVCPNCGNPVNEVVVHEECETEHSYVPKRKTKGLLCVVVTIVVIAVVAVAAYLFATKGDDTVKIDNAFIEAVHHYDRLDGFSEGLAAVCKDGKWGYINTRGEEVIQCKFNYAASFSEGLAAAQDMSEKWGYINAKGEWVIKPQYEVYSDFSEGIACVANAFNDGEPTVDFIDKQGKRIETISNKYKKYISYDDEGRTQSFVNGRCDVWSDDGDVSQIDKEGNRYKEKKDEKEICEKYEYIIFMDKDNSKFGIKDKLGNMVVPAKYDYIQSVYSYYDEISNELNEYPLISNGVVLVRNSIVAPDSDEILAECYGYADLFGNDTFNEVDRSKLKQSSEELRQREEEAERQRLQAEREAEQEQLYGWLQGTWTYSTSLINVKLVFNGTYASMYMNGDVMSQGEISIDEQNQIISIGTAKVRYSSSSQTLYPYDGDGSYRKVDAASYSSSVSSSSNQDKEAKLMKTLHELGEEGKSQIAKLQRMRSSGRFDPMEYIYIKQRCMTIKDRQISIARQLNDNELARQYQEQKRILEQMFRTLE